MQLFQCEEIVYLDQSVLVVAWLNETDVLQKAGALGGTIKIGKISDYSIVELWKDYQWKFQYWVSSFSKKINLKKYLLALKKELKLAWVSSRFVNKDFGNLNSAQIISEKLVKKWTDYSIVDIDGVKTVFQTIWVQDIDAYSQRDYGKSRDMQVWMLPPKLCQIMINISWWKKIYDPFVGLWTVLIESVYMWNTEVYGSDLSDSMVFASTQNLQSLKPEFDFISQIEKLNAKFIWEFPQLHKTDAIVTEWYLWEVMTQKNISLERIEKQKQSLEKIYKWFFSSLKKSWYSWTIVLCFPFWEIHKKYIYADNLYSILESYAKIEQIIPQENILEKYQTFTQHTKSWSLLYKRKNQLVWREICKLTIL